MLQEVEEGSRVGSAGRRRFGHVLPTPCHVPKLLVTVAEPERGAPQPQRFPSPQGTRQLLAGCTSRARTGGGSGAQPPSKAGASVFLPAAAFCEAQGQPVGCNQDIPGGRRKLHPTKETSLWERRHRSSQHEPAALEIFPQRPFKTIFPSKDQALYLCSGDIYYLASLLIIH